MACKVKQTKISSLYSHEQLQIDFANKTTLKILVFRQRIRIRM